QNWIDEVEIGLFFGYFSDEQIPPVLATIKRFADRMEQIERQDSGWTTPEDSLQQKALLDEMMITLRNVASPAEIEEGELRIMYVMTYLFRSSKLEGLNLTGFELRELMRLKKLHQD